MEKSTLLSACLTAWLGLTHCNAGMAQQRPPCDTRLESTIQKDVEQLRTHMMEACVTTLTKQMNQGGFLSPPSLYHTGFAYPLPEGVPKQSNIPIYLDARSVWETDDANRPIKHDRSFYMSHPGTLAQSITTTYERNQAVYQQRITGLYTEVKVLDDAIHIRNPKTTISLYGTGIADKARVAEEVIRTGSARTKRKVIKYPTSGKKDHGFILQVDDLFIAVEDQALE